MGQPHCRLRAVRFRFTLIYHHYSTLIYCCKELKLIRLSPFLFYFTSSISLAFHLRFLALFQPSPHFDDVVDDS